MSSSASLPSDVDFSESIKQLFFVQSLDNLGTKPVVMNDVPTDLVTSILTSTSFYKTSQFHKIFGIQSIPIPTSSEVGSTVDMRYLTAMSTVTADMPSVHSATESLKKYFLSPARAIKCKEPEDYKIAIRDLHTTLFRQVYKQVYSTVHQQTSYSSIKDVFLYHFDSSGFEAFFMPMIDAIITETESVAHVSQTRLADFLKQVKEQIAQFDHRRYVPILTNAMKSLIYSVFYPYFVFLYILSFIQNQEQGAAPAAAAAAGTAGGEERRSFYVHRVAKLACYLYVFHMMRHLLFLHHQVGSDSTSSNEEHTLLLRRVIDNITLNVLEQENAIVRHPKTGVPSYYNTVRELSIENRKQTERVNRDTTTFDQYKHNLMSVLANESVVAQARNRARWVLSAHMVMAFVITLALLFSAASNQTAVFYMIAGFVILFMMLIALASMLGWAEL
jgi:hypothetical protein